MQYACMHGDEKGPHACMHVTAGKTMHAWGREGAACMHVTAGKTMHAWGRKRGRNVGVGGKGGGMWLSDIPYEVGLSPM